MKKSRLIAVLLASTTGLVAGSSVASVDVSALATGFQTDFTAAAAVIGVAMISAAFGAIIYKWIKAMVFGG